MTGGVVFAPAPASLSGFAPPLRGAELTDHLVFDDAALAWEDGFITFAGRRADLPPSHEPLETFYVDGAVIPGLVDCHTHVQFVGWRADESALGVKGKVEKMIAELAAEDPEFDAEVGFNEHWLWGPRIPYEVNDSWEILRTVGRATEVALGAPAEHVGMMAWTDMAVLGQAGTEAVNIGPGGSPLNFADEYVLESEFEGAIRTYVSAAIDYCNQPP